MRGKIVIEQPNINENLNQNQNNRKRTLLLLISLCIILEVLCYFQTTFLRYGFQSLKPNYFNLFEIGNVIVFVSSIILIMNLISFWKNQKKIFLVIILFVISLASLLAISNFQPDVISINHKNYWYANNEILKVYASFLFLKIFEYSFVKVLNKSSNINYFNILSSILKKYLKILFIISISVLLFVYFYKFKYQNERYDIAVVPGAAVWSNNIPSPVLKQRYLKAYDLLKKDKVGLIVLTGSNAPLEKAESVVAYNELIKLGADPERIVYENETHSTLQQVLYIRDNKMLMGYKRIIFVSDDFHLFRLYQITIFNGLNASFVESISPLKPKNKLFYYLRETLAVMLYWVFGV